MITPIKETNLPAFKAVYRSNLRNANEYQREVMEDIKEKFSSQNYKDNSGLTPVENYERRGIDLLLKPGFGNSVDVLAVTNMQKGNLRHAPKYNTLSYIGTYGPSHEFAPTDVNKKLNDNNHYLPFFAFLELAWVKMVQKMKNVFDKRK